MYHFYRENNCNSLKNETEAAVATLVTNHRARIGELVKEQTKEWSDLVARQMTEEHECRKSHVTQQTDLLRKLMEEVQATQLKDMELRQER